MRHPVRFCGPFHRLDDAYDGLALHAESLPVRFVAATEQAGRDRRLDVIVARAQSPICYESIRLLRYSPSFFTSRGSRACLSNRIAGTGSQLKLEALKVEDTQNGHCRRCSCESCPQFSVLCVMYSCPRETFNDACQFSIVDLEAGRVFAGATGRTEHPL